MSWLILFAWAYSTCSEHEREPRITKWKIHTHSGIQPRTFCLQSERAKRCANGAVNYRLMMTGFHLNFLCKLPVSRIYLVACAIFRNLACIFLIYSLKEVIHNLTDFFKCAHKWTICRIMKLLKKNVHLRYLIVSSLIVPLIGNFLSTIFWLKCSRKKPICPLQSIEDALYIF